MAAVLAHPHLDVQVAGGRLFGDDVRSFDFQTPSPSTKGGSGGFVSLKGHRSTNRTSTHLSMLPSFGDKTHDWRRRARPRWSSPCWHLRRRHARRADSDVVDSCTQRTPGGRTDTLRRLRRLPTPRRTARAPCAGFCSRPAASEEGRYRCRRRRRRLGLAAGC